MPSMKEGLADTRFPHKVPVITNLLISLKFSQSLLFRYVNVLLKFQIFSNDDAYNTPVIFN